MKGRGKMEKEKFYEEHRLEVYEKFCELYPEKVYSDLMLEEKYPEIVDEIVEDLMEYYDGITMPGFEETTELLDQLTIRGN